MAIYSQLSLAKKRFKGYSQSTVSSQKKNVEMAIFSQLSLAKKGWNGYVHVQSTVTNVYPQSV